MADQALSSLTNFVLTFLAARTLAPAPFGAFALAFAAYLTGLGVARAVGTEPFSVRYSTAALVEWRRAAARASGSATVVGLVLGAVMLAAGLVLRGQLRVTLISIAVFMPGLLLQDTWRFTFFAARRGRSAAANDLSWVICLASALAVVFRRGAVGAPELAVAWGASGSVAGLVGIWQARVIPRPMAALGWWREHRDLGGRFAAEFATTFGAGQLVLYVVGAVAGLAAVGAIRAAQVLLGPLNVVFMGSGLFGVPEAARAAARSRRHVEGLGALLSLATGGAALAWTALVLVLPDTVGLRLLQEAWGPARAVVLPVGLWMASAGVSLGSATVLRGLADARTSLCARVIQACAALGGASLGALAGGAAGAAWGGACAGALSAAVWWALARRSLARHEQALVAGGSGGSVR
jgi:O-antigen/teichoic acid export membrane protein